MNSDDRFRRLLNEITHCLITPLNLIIARSDRALRGEPSREEVMNIRALSAHMRAKVYTLMAVGRLNAKESIETHLDSIPCSRIVQVLRDTVRDAELCAKGEKLKFEFAVKQQNERTFDIDLNVFQLALQNLIAYARENSWRESSIRIEATIADRVVISIRYIGTPIPPNDFQHVFERGWKAAFSSDWEWTGSKLWIVRELAKATGFTASVNGKGNCTTFVLELPYSES